MIGVAEVMSNSRTSPRRGILFERQYIEAMPHDEFIKCRFEKCVFVGCGGARLLDCILVNCTAACPDALELERCEMRNCK